MIELKNDRLMISFPEIHVDARMSIDFQRTLRIPDDGQVHYLPPGLGDFPLRHVDDFTTRVPAAWKEHGGVMMPMWQSEAMWIHFGSFGFDGYPFLVKIATGKINAVSGEEWREGAHRDPQDYVVVPGQPWLDGYCVKKGEIAQFVAMPLGEGYTAEEQITGEAEFGGVQIMVYPMKAGEWEKLLKARENAEPDFPGAESCKTMFCMMESPDMGLAPGGRMKQDIKEDPYGLDVWDLRHGSRVFVHIANSLAWRAMTGEVPPTVPPTARHYMEAGLPWFDHYGEGEALAGSDQLAGLQTVLELGVEKGEKPLIENESFDPGDTRVVKLGPGKDIVREGDF